MVIGERAARVGDSQSICSDELARGLKERVAIVVATGIVAVAVCPVLGTEAQFGSLLRGQSPAAVISPQCQPVCRCCTECAN